MSRIYASPDTTLNLQSTVFPQPVYITSIFPNHKLQPADFHINLAQKPESDWMLAILVVCFILLAWVRVFYPKRVQQIFRAPFSKRFINQLTRDGNLFGERFTIAMGIIYILTQSLFLYLINDRVFALSYRGLPGISIYLLIAVLTVGFMSVKVTLVMFLGTIFKTRETTGNYLLNILIFSLLSGPVLLAFLVFIIYLQSPIPIYFCTAVLVLLMTFRFLRGFFIGMALGKFSYLFLFVYLCSLEILPLVVLIKILLKITHTAGP